jgi:predicted nucleotidyltransferase
MRLTILERNLIIQTIYNVFGQDVKIWLFGSRVDDSKRGGDIDLYVEVMQPFAQCWQKKIAVLTSLQIQLDDQKIDLIVHCLNDKEYPINQIAKKTGIQINYDYL